MRGKKIIFIILLLLLSSIVFFKYYTFKKYAGIYNEESSYLAERIEQYSINRFENIPNNENDFSKMLDWLKEDSKIEAILSYGINFKYDSIDKTVAIYSFGIDKTDDNLNEPSYSTSDKNYTIFGENDVIENTAFWDIFDTNGKDVLILKGFVGEDYLCVNYAKSDFYTGEELLVPLASTYIFFQGNTKVSGDLEKRLREKVRPYKYLINPDIPVLNDETKISFIRYKDGKFDNVCNDEIEMSVFDSEIKRYFIQNNVDYAIIPILK